jgi:hypothetical protein
MLGHQLGVGVDYPNASGVEPLEIAVCYAGKWRKVMRFSVLRLSAVSYRPRSNRRKMVVHGFSDLSG